MRPIESLLFESAPVNILNWPIAARKLRNNREESNQEDYKCDPFKLEASKTWFISSIEYKIKSRNSTVRGGHGVSVDGLLCTIKYFVTAQRVLLEPFKNDNVEKARRWPWGIAALSCTNTASPVPLRQFRWYQMYGEG